MKTFTVTIHDPPDAPDPTADELRHAILTGFPLMNGDLVKVKPAGEEKATRCVECGGTDVQVVAWIDPNTGETFDWYSDDNPEMTWCGHCDENFGEGHTGVLTDEKPGT